MRPDGVGRALSEIRLRKAIGEGEWPKVCFALSTGFRRGNRFRRKWTHVNFDTGILHASDTKFGKDYRVPMNDELRATLRDLASRLRSKWVFPSANGETPIAAKHYMNRVFVPA